MCVIRLYQTTDQKALLELIDLNTPQYFAPAERTDFERYLQKEREDYFVLEKDGATVGCGGINYEESGATAVLSWGMIHPQYHGQGLGTLVCKHRLQHIRKKTDIKRVVVRTSQHAQRFYHKMGFQTKKVENHYWGEDLHLHYMEIEL